MSTGIHLAPTPCHWLFRLQPLENVKIASCWRLFRFNCLLKLNCAAIARCTLPFAGLNDAGICWLCRGKKIGVEWKVALTSFGAFAADNCWRHMSATNYWNHRRKSPFWGKHFALRSDKSGPNGASLNVGLEPRARPNCTQRNDDAPLCQLSPIVKCLPSFGQAKRDEIKRVESRDRHLKY